MAAEAEVKAAEAADNSERMANAYMALRDAGSHDAEARAQALDPAPGFKTTELDKTRSTASPAAGECAPDWRAR